MRKKPRMGRGRRWLKDNFHVSYDLLNKNGIRIRTGYAFFQTFTLAKFNVYDFCKKEIEVKDDEKLMITSLSKVS